MTYLWFLRVLQRVVHELEARTGWWTFTDWHGRIAFRQIDYAKRVQKASGWEPVVIGDWSPPRWTITGPASPTFTTTTGTNTTVTYRRGG